MNKILAVAFALIVFACQEKQAPADMIISGGIIYTMDDAYPQAEAVAISNGKIIFVGSSAEVQKYKGEKTQLIDLKGETMTPGFIESHGHIMGLGYNELNLDLMDTKSWDEIVSRVKEAADKAKPG